MSLRSGSSGRHFRATAMLSLACIALAFAISVYLRMQARDRGVDASPLESGTVLAFPVLLAVAAISSGVVAYSLSRGRELGWSRYTAGIILVVGVPLAIAARLLAVG